MSHEGRCESNERPSRMYQIRIEGKLAAHWDGWFEGMTLRHVEGGDTLLCGPVIDQAALHGLIRKVRDLGLPLLSIMEVTTTAMADPDGSTTRSQDRNGAEGTTADPDWLMNKLHAGDRKDTK